MGIQNPPGPVHQQHGGRAGQEELLDLEVLRSHLGSFIAQHQVRGLEGADMPFNHLGPIGHHHHDLGIQSLECWVVMTQLRHMIGAVRSGKANIKNQQHVLVPVNLG